ncbi:MAG: cupredoxin domain-containing protein [Actinomycetota bacterium]
MAIGRRSVVVVLVLGLVGAACGSDEPSVGSGGGVYASPSGSVAVGSATPTAGGGYGQGGGGSGGGGRKSDATLAQSNYRFTPTTLSVASGDTITVSNTTPSTPHTFTIDGQKIDVAMDPASSQDVQIHLPPGTYDFYCRYHRSSGMTGTLTVT